MKKRSHLGTLAAGILCLTAAEGRPHAQEPTPGSPTIYRDGYGVPVRGRSLLVFGQSGDADAVESYVPGESSAP
jgi:hypothetical protein